MSFATKSKYALVPTTAVLLSFLFSSKLLAAPEPGVCSGVLTKSGEELAIAEEPEHICTFTGEAKRKILTVCVEGHYCEVEGILDDCKDTGECSEITNVGSVRVPDAPPPPQPFDLASLPAEIRLEIEPVLRTCNSPVTMVGEFSGYLIDHDDRFLAFHFENVRCADLTAICRRDGCLHQVYSSKGNGPYQLEASAYAFEVELGRFDGAPGVKVTSKGGTRIVRLPQ